MTRSIGIEIRDNPRGSATFFPFFQFLIGVKRVFAYQDPITAPQLEAKHGPQIE
jgi:hypothetical protein